MLWHAGDVVSAVSEVKRTGSTFIVYIYGSDEGSQKTNASWESAAVAQALQGNAVVALRLASDSPGCSQFNQIYPVICVPSTFFIGDEGVPLEVIPGECSESDLAKKIRDALQMHRNQRSAAGNGTQPAAVAEPATGAASPATSTGSSGSMLDRSDGSRPVVAASSTAAAAADGAELASGQQPEPSVHEQRQAVPVDLREKVTRAQELIQRKQQERQQQQLEERRQKEAERRQLGQEMARLKQMQAEQNALEAAAEIRKDKEDEKLARQRVRDQIAKDRAEKAERFQKEKDERRAQTELLEQEKLAAEEQERARQAATRSNVAKIQFRLPDGSSVANQFLPTDTLETARQYLALHSPSPLGRDFRLSTAYPRRIFTVADMQSTLADLQLAPSAALVVLPPLSLRSTTSGQLSSQQPLQRATDTVWSFVQLLLAPLLALWNFVYALLFGAGAAARPAAAGQQRPAARAPAAAASPSADQRRPFPGTRSTIRDGNIARLSSLDDPDDPNATWNGNSTQQK